MYKTRISDHRDTKVDTRIVLSGLWVSMLFVCNYTVLFGFFRADVVAGALAGTVPEVGFEIDQTFLALCTAHVLFPILMIVVSLVAPARVNRVANIVVSVLHLATIAATVVGETWVYFILLSAVEVALLLAITRVAWTWRVRSTSEAIPVRG